MRRQKCASTDSIMICTECGQRGIPIRRVVGQDRHKGHLKTIWCCNCKKETRHHEIRSWDVECWRTMNGVEKRKAREEERKKKENES